MESVWNLHCGFIEFPKRIVDLTETSLNSSLNTKSSNDIEKKIDRQLLLENERQVVILNLAIKGDYLLPKKLIAASKRNDQRKVSI